HRARRGQRPGPGARHSHPGRRRLCAERGQAVDHQRCDRRPAGGDGSSAQERGTPRWDHRVRGGGGCTGHRGGESQRVHGVARYRKRPHPADQRAGTGREPHRPRRRRAEDRAVHAQRRAAFAAGAVYRVGEMVSEDRQGVVRGAGAVGPVGEHEAVAGKVAFIAATAYGLEAMLDLATELADAGRTDIRIEAALAKLYGSEMAWLIADELVQIRGGRGYETAESLAARGERGVPAEQVLRDLRINRIFEGSTEIMHLMIAREAVDAHLSVAGDIIDPEADLRHKAHAAGEAGKFYARWLPTLVTGKGQLPTSFSEFGSLASHLRYVERASRRLARSTFYGMSRWQGKLEYKQRFLGRIVDIGAELFAMTAACVRAQRDKADQSAVELADAFCNQARVRAEQLFDQLWHNCDDSDRKFSQRVLEDRYTWLEDGVLDPSIEGPWIAQDAS